MNLFTLFNGACSDQIAFCWRTRMAWNALAIGRVRWKLWRMMQNRNLLALPSFSTLKSWYRINLACKAETMPRDAGYLAGIEAKRTSRGGRRKSGFVESPGGISPPGAPRTVHDPLKSHGSRCSAVAMTYRPMSKECWFGTAE